MNVPLSHDERQIQGLLQKCLGYERQIESVVNLCRLYGTPATEPGAHALANKVLQLLGEREAAK